MEITRHTEIIQNLLSLVSEENQATASEQLTELSEDYSETTTNYNNLVAENNTLKENNEKLRKANTDLFLKVGEKVTDNSQANNNLKDNEDKKINFDTLFNEKGELL